MGKYSEPIARCHTSGRYVCCCCYGSSGIAVNLEGLELRQAGAHLHVHPGQRVHGIAGQVAGADVLKSVANRFRGYLINIRGREEVGTQCRGAVEHNLGPFEIARLGEPDHLALHLLVNRIRRTRVHKVLLPVNPVGPVIPEFKIVVVSALIQDDSRAGRIQLIYRPISVVGI